MTIRNLPEKLKNDYLELLLERAGMCSFRLNGVLRHLKRNATTNTIYFMVGDWPVEVTPKASVQAPDNLPQQL